MNHTNADETVIDDYLGAFTVRLSPNHSIEEHILKYGSWEKDVALYIQCLVGEGSICVDVGANSGIHSLWMAHHAGKNGKVYSFDPNPVTIPRLMYNISLNPDFKDRIIVEQKGVSNRAGSLKLFHSGELYGNAYMGEAFNEKLWNTGGPDDFVECEVLTLDSYFGLQKVDLIKADVEGMELEVISGAQRVLEAWKPYLIYESLVHEFDSDKLLKLERYLESLGYYLYAISREEGKLVRVRHPVYLADTLAIHQSRIMRCADYLKNAVRYRFEHEITTRVFGGPIHVTVVGVNEDEFLASVSCISTAPLVEAQTRRDGGTLCFNADYKGQSIPLDLKMFEVSSEGTILSTQIPRLRLGCDGTEHEIEGAFVGGLAYGFES
ncbi:MAG: FkbM family methyltransferase [Bdellovibrionales bacterium]|nr:FkbM family methyltransferase [Bdellovibrionales bacterium]